MSANPPSTSQRAEYWARINRAIDFIERNLDKPLSLEEIARAADFSPYHFHRIFGAMMGETLSHFVQRIRLERALAHLAGNPRKSITAIAFDCGFSSPSVFARSFRDAYGMSASQWRARCRADGGTNSGLPAGESKNRKANRKTGQTNRKDREAAATNRDYTSSEAGRTGLTVEQIRRNAMLEAQELQVRVEDLPEMHVAYVRHVGPYAGDEALFEGLFERLMRWAGPRDLLRFPETKTLIIYHDDPNVTDDARLRTSVCITVPPETEVDGEIGKMVVPGGKYAMAHFEIDPEEYGNAWDALCGAWLPDSGYQPDDRPSFELCLNDPNEHPEHKHVVDICVPVKPL